MPISAEFESRLNAILPDAIRYFGTPFYLYDERGIAETLQQINATFADLRFREFFAVKALPNPRMLSLIAEHGAGFDCGSLPDLSLARQATAAGADIIFSSNNTTREEFTAARELGALINVDDIALLDKLGATPDALCFRLNPGALRLSGGSSVESYDQKFGMRPDQLLEACEWARRRGVRHLGLHAMVVTNQLSPEVHLCTLSFLLDTAAWLAKAAAIRIDFVDVGGGLGIPYRPGEPAFDLAGFGASVRELINDWTTTEGLEAPALFLEAGRYVTGPHGVLVTRVINYLRKWRNFAGVDAGISAMIRPALYEHAYHHISVFQPDSAQTEVVDVVGSMCENNDKLATARELPPLRVGNILCMHDVGAHGHAMGFTYNNRLRPKELLLRADGSVELIRRAETDIDHFATLTTSPEVLRPAVIS
jgi:diaminopimelate decarboxylase